MITFANAKINLGLRVIRKLPSGYHQLETIFYPIGKYNGTPACPYPFCDIIEATPSDSGFSLTVNGWNETLDIDKNIVYKAYKLFSSEIRKSAVGINLILEKHIPTQAGLGGGSADGALTLKMLNEIYGTPLTQQKLAKLALRLGADCPFFLLNSPALGQGVGEVLTPVADRLHGMWCVIAKPKENMPTAQAFGLITPEESNADTLTQIYNADINKWPGQMINDFEKAFLKLYPHCRSIKEQFYVDGALYASLSGSGAAFYAIFADHESALTALQNQKTPFKTLALL